MKKIESHFDELYTLLSSEDFLMRKGVSTEVPFFICHYDATEQVKSDGVVKLLVEKLNTRGVKTLHIDLYKIMIEKMRANDDLDWTLENEGTVDHENLLTDMRAQLNVKTEIAPMIAEMIKFDDYRLVIVTGIGACYPIFEAHELLTNLSEIVTGVPLVLFFPGDYVQAPGSGASLHLFGRVEGRGYYRAFDIETFLKMNEIRQSAQGTQS